MAVRQLIAAGTRRYPRSIVAVSPFYPDLLKSRSKWQLGAITFAVAVAVIFITYLAVIVPTGLGLAFDLLLYFLSAIITIALCSKITVAIAFFFSAIPSVSGAVIGSFVALSLIPSLLGVPAPIPLLFAVGFIPVATVLGGTLTAVLGGDIRKASTVKKVAILALLACTVALNVVGSAWLANSGSDDHLVKNIGSNANNVVSLNLPNPATPGRYQVQTWFYGSGTDSHRQEYSTAVNLKTNSVDASPFLPHFTGFKAKLHQHYWGFDLQHLPLNGRVWFPVGEGQFPLVVIVHGNHLYNNFSDPGYAYLGELLASRGLIVVSVDENFLNGPWISAYGQELPTRAWILLQHLKLWRTWNKTVTNPVYHKVDLDKIALIGHSRGGEAIAIAAVFNRLSRYPDNANIQFDFNFGLKSLIAIAPSEGFYRPSNQPISLENLNYLVLHGSHDSDVTIFKGSRQYHRLKFTEHQSWFKSALYIYRANHNQFNTVWGSKDFPAPLSWFLNLKPLIDGKAQRQIAITYISAFLEATVHNQQGYKPLFQDYRVITSWLPKTIYVNRFQDSSDLIINDYEDDVDVTSTTLAGGVVQANNFKIWREQQLKFRLILDSFQENNVVYLDWDTLNNQNDTVSIPPIYDILIPEKVLKTWQISSKTSLIFSLANATTNSEFLDLTIELIDLHDTTVNLSLSQFASISPPLTIQFLKSKWLERILWHPHELVLQSYELPLAKFIQVNPQFKLKEIKTIRFKFDRSAIGAIALDEIGLRQVRR